MSRKMSRKTDNRPLSGWLQAFLQIDKKKAKDIIAVGSKGSQQLEPMVAFLQRVRDLRTQDFKKHRQLTRYFDHLVQEGDETTLRFITLLRQDLVTALKKSYDVLADAPRQLTKRQETQLETIEALMKYLEPLLVPLPPNTDLEDMIAQIADEMAEPPSASGAAAGTTEGYDQDDLDLVLEDLDAARRRLLNVWALEPGAINATTARNNTDFRDDADDANQDGLMAAKLAKLAKGNANAFRNPLRL